MHRSFITSPQQPLPARRPEPASAGQQLRVRGQVRLLSSQAADNETTKLIRGSENVDTF